MLLVMTDAGARVANQWCASTTMKCSCKIEFSAFVVGIALTSISDSRSVVWYLIRRSLHSRMLSRRGRSCSGDGVATQRRRVRARWRAEAVGDDEIEDVDVCAHHPHIVRA